MPISAGIALAIAMGVFARITGFDRDRAFYPTVLMVVGSYYILFAAMAGGGEPLLVESAIFVLFVIAAVAGFQLTMWIVVAGLAAHGLFDLARGPLLPGTGVPAWWPDFCMGFDIAAAIWLAILLRMRRFHHHHHHHRRNAGNSASAS